MVFFGLHSIAGGLLVIIVLLLGIICLIVFSWQVSSKVAWLLAPYLGWVCFAGYLNYQLWLLNS
jgi:tryptophan-rich sensory protein